jgi:hypothetical protein
MQYIGYGYDNTDQVVADGDAVRIQGSDVIAVNGEAVSQNGEFTPNYGYKSSDAAAVAWSLRYGKGSIDESKEASSLIYTKNDDKGSIKYSYTEGRNWADNLANINPARSSPGPGLLRRIFEDLLKDAIVIAHIHSHGSYALESDERFSYWNDNPDNRHPHDDNMFQEERNLMFYLLTPNGNLYRRESESNTDDQGQSRIIAAGFSHDQKAEKADNGRATDKKIISYKLTYFFQNFKNTKTKESDLKPQ